jgi:translocation and assembly module TamB
MTRGRKIAAIAAGSLVGLVIMAFLAGILIVRTDWFRNMVREKIVTAVEDATGGKVEIASFSFDWQHLRAHVRGFAIHGLEPPTAAPLLRANLVQVDLKLLSPFQGFVDIAYLLVDTPQANIIVYPDGHTNIPAPKIQPKSNGKTGVETIVDLAIGRFDLRHGALTFAERKSELNASGADLRAQLGYNTLASSYTGEIDISPLSVQSGGNPALTVYVKLPLTVAKDKITLANAQLSTPNSQILVSGSMDHLIAPRTSGHLNAKVALDEIQRAFGLALPLDTAHGPRFLTADITGSMDDNQIRIQAARASLGHSDIEASGTLKDAGNAGSVQFRSTLALGEMGALFRVSARPEGTVKVGGTAALAANNEYKVVANLDARGVAVRQGTTRIAGVSLDAAVKADPHRIELSGLRLAALGGSFTGSAAIQDLAQFHVAGNLHNFDLADMARAFLPGALGYDGVISGPLKADGDIRDSSALIARADLGIAPGAHGIPVSGHVGVGYNSRAGTVDLDHSRLALPHTTAEFSGSLGKQIQVRLVSRDLADFQPLMGANTAGANQAAIPVTFTGNGAATIDATVTGRLDAPRIAGQVAVTNFAVDGRPFTRFAATLDASQSSAAVTNAVLSRGALQAQFSATVGLHNWKAESYQPLKADLVIRDADLRDVLALADQAGFPATGALQADAHINGTIGSPAGTADFTVAHGELEGEPFDSITAHAVLSQTAADVPAFSMLAGPSRIDATANYRHAVNDLQHGAITAHVASNQVQLAQFQSLVKDRPGLRGLLNLNADVTGAIAPAAGGTQFQLNTLTATAAARNLEMEGRALGDFTATASTAGSTASTTGAAIHYNVDSNFAGSTIRVSGQSLLAGDHQTSATASIANLPIDRVMAVAGRRDLPVKGTLTASAQLSGTLQNPRGNGTVTVANGSAYNEPFARLQASVNYTDVLIDIPELRIDDGPSNLVLSASLNHPAGDLEDGQLQFHVRSNEIQISRIHTVADARPGLAGIVQVTAEGAATLHRNAPIAFSALTANLSAHNLSMNKKDLGGLTATAATRGNAVSFTVNSDFANARISGSGHLDLAAQYPIDAQLNFTGVTWSGLSPFLAATPATTAQPFDASLDGQVTVSGPTARPEALRGNLQLTKLEAHSVVTSAAKAPRVKFEMHNDGNIQASLANSVVTVQNFRVTGPYTNLTIGGTASIGTASIGTASIGTASNNAPQPLNLRVNGNVKLDVLEAFSTDIVSSGAVTLNATVAGNTSQPVVNGRLQLQNASFNLMSLPNGLSNANGAVNFNGTQAVVENLTGQTGGGKVTLAGSVSYGGPETRFRIQATAAHVHVDYPETVTTEADARLSLAGTESRSLLSGDVTILNVAIHSHSDVGSMLTSAATPPPANTNSTGLLGGMRFDVRIRTSPDVQFRTSLTQNLQADADLTLRGSPDHPGMLGRLVVNSGNVVFFGATYTVDQGTVTFYNPNKVIPVLNVALETTVQGVDVTVGVSGPMDKLKLAYHSDPPLEFQQIVSLLASGKQPVTDPVLAAHQPPAQQQNIEQAGASTVLSQAVANPVSGRLQRLFGVSKLSIDPQIVGSSSNNPQATLTLQQQVTHSMTFTYIQDVSQSNPSAIRIEWAINPQFSAVAQRDIYGEFALDFFYKKRFH